MIKKCPTCGGAVKSKTGPGRLMRHYTMELEVPEDIAIPTCVKCGEQWIDHQLGQKIDKALQKIYEGVLVEKARNAIESLASVAKRSRLEALLGLSPGYMSRIGKKVPSPALVAILGLLAQDPKRLDDLVEIWGGEPGGAAEKKAS